MKLLYEGSPGWGSTAYPGDAGIDLPITQQVILAPGEYADLPSGIKVAIPDGYYGRIAARSGALRNRRIRVYEGVIDAGYRGELYSYVENVGTVATVIQPGDRLAQLIVQALPIIEIECIAQLPPSLRGTAGFGSSDRRPDPDPVVDHKEIWSAASPYFDESAQVALPRRDPWIPKVYLGGPLDFKDHRRRDEHIALIHERFPAVFTFDPLRANVGVADPGEVWRRNHTAMKDCEIGVFLFDDPEGGYGFGSPIEIASMLADHKVVIVWHDSPAIGTYLRKMWQDDGLIIAESWSDFIRLLDEEIAKVRNG